MENTNIHTGHRQRVFENYLKSGLDGFSDVELLELLLFYAYLKQDTNTLAHRLLDAFTSLPGVFEATIEQLCQVQGITKRAAILLHMQAPIWRRYEIACRKVTTLLQTTAACAEYLLPFFHGARDEQVWVLCMDAKCDLLCCKKVFSGSVNTASIPCRKVMELALAVNASIIVLAHNHTSGIALPSREDLQSTQHISQLLNSVEIVLADHIIVADNDYVSLKDSHLL